MRRCLSILLILAATRTASSAPLADGAAVRFDVPAPVGIDWNLRLADVPFAAATDLSPCAGVSFELRCADRKVLTDVWLLFHSGRGYWRARVALPEKAGVWTSRTVLKRDVRLYHWDTHVSLFDVREEVSEAETPDWRRVGGLRLVVGFDPTLTSADATVEIRNVVSVAAGSADEREALKASAARHAATLAAVRAMPSRGGERRFLCTHMWGLDDDWERSCALAASNGITDIVPLVALEGYAYYGSKIETVSPLVAKRGDPLAACLKACRRHGLRCHPWRSCWTLGHSATEAYLAEMEGKGLLQVGFDGRRVDWFCPNNPANVRREVASLVELAHRGADGIMLDYFRFPSSNACFCATCRAAFGRHIGRAVSPWPAAVRTDAALAREWEAFRVATITDALKAVAEGVRRAAPGLELSSAVSAMPDWGRTDRGQDWEDWCRAGILDLVLPMDYCSHVKQLEMFLAAQKRAVAGTRTRLCPLIAFACGGIPFLDPDELGRQIGAVRAAGVKDWGFFRLEEYAPAALEMLRQGPLKESR